MPGIFNDSGISTSVTLASGTDTLTGYQNTWKTPLKNATLSMDIGAGTGTFKVYARFYNGVAWMKYHQVKDDDLTEVFSCTDTVETSLKNQDWWKDTVYGVQVKVTRESGTGDIAFSNGLLTPVV